MHLYIVRHAEAHAAGTEGIMTDEARFLTTKGRKQAQRVGRLFARLNMRPSAIFTSPLVRARETAELLAGELPATVKIRIEEALAPPGQLGRIEKRIARAGDEAQLVFVGHEPFLGELLHRLAAGQGDASLPLSKGAVACLRVKQGNIRLRWLLNQQLLKAFST